ncbi:MAG TPA: ABC transporter permease [Chloroflexia bacterium]|nr:ABC transporter permease [Chloroflexia bacterium]
MDYLIYNWDRVWPRILEHLMVSGLSLAFALAISLPLGLLLNRRQALGGPVLVVLGTIYSIPSLALLALLVPFVGIGLQPAVIALTAYALVVLVRNTMVGFNNVDPAVKEAATGMGMSGRQMLWRIEVPLALPVVVAGIRIAALSTIALTAVAGLAVGAGGLGQILKEGINNPSKLYAGVISIAAIAIVTDGLFRLLERTVRVPR